MKLLIVSIVLLLAGGLAMTFGDTRGEEPAVECAAEGTPSSGFTDEEQGGCPLSVESWNAYSEWRTQPQPVKIAGLFATVIGVGLAVGVGVTTVVQKTRKQSNDAA